MNIYSPENKFLNFVKSNSKIFIYSLAIILITLSVFFWYLNNQENNNPHIDQRLKEGLSRLTRNTLNYFDYSSKDLCC